MGPLSIDKTMIFVELSF